MAIELLIAPPASGKTEACIQRIKEVQVARPLAKVWVIVPDFQNKTYFGDRLAESCGGIDVTIGFFRDFYRLIRERNGDFLPIITSALKHRLVQETVDEASNAGELQLYEAIKRKPGFILVLQNAFAELREAMVLPDRFLEYTQGSTQARCELALLYERYLNHLQELDWTDREGQGWLALDALARNSQLAADVQLLVVDGFNSFIPAHRQFLKRLASQAEQTLITLPGEKDSSRMVHRRSQIEIDALQRELSPQITSLSKPPQMPPMLAHLQAHVLDPGKFDVPMPSYPILLEMRSQTEEVREALRWIKQLHVREGIPLTDCALFASNLAEYQPLLRMAAEEYGMPLHFIHPEPLLEAASIQSLINFLLLPQDDYKTRTLLNCLRSPFFEFGLDAKALDGLEGISRRACIVIGREQWNSTWKLLEEKRNVTEEDPNEEYNRDDPAAGLDIPALKDALENIWRIFEATTTPRSQREWVTWLNELLDHLGFYRLAINERDLEACGALGDALKALVMSESVAGTRVIDYTQFLSDLQGTLQGARIDEPKEDRGNGLLVGKIIEARGARYTAVVLLGFSEGSFPSVERADPFLDEELRHDLGLEPMLGREQASMFHQALTRANDHLLITRPYLTGQGETWDPSPYWLACMRLLNKCAVQRISPDDPRPQSEAASSQELLFWSIRQDGLKYPSDMNLAQRWQALEHARRILVARRSKVPQGEYEGIVEALSPDLTNQYAPERTMSPSRLESYGTCPFKFYTENILKLEPKEPPELGLDAAQRGSIYHEILEKVYASAGSNRDAGQLITMLDDIAATVFLEAPLKQGFRPSPLWEVEKSESLEKLRATIQALEDLSAEWAPYSFEQQFGLENSPALSIDLDGERLLLRGKIDRVDKDSAGHVRVIDYKTGGSNMSAADLLNGRRLQLPIYALAAGQALGLGQVVEGFYWKINDASSSSLKLSNFKEGSDKGPQAAYAVLLKHLKRIVHGIRAGDFPPKPPKGGCPGYCPAVQWCWRRQMGFQG